MRRAAEQRLDAALVVVRVQQHAARCLAVAAGASSDEFFTLLLWLLSERGVRLFLINRGVLPALCGLIGCEARRIHVQEGLRILDHAQGLALRRLVQILALLLELDVAACRLSCHEPLPALLDALLLLRGLLTQKTAHTDACASQLAQVLASFFVCVLMPLLVQGIESRGCAGRGALRCKGQPDSSRESTPHQQ